MNPTHNIVLFGSYVLDIAVMQRTVAIYRTKMTLEGFKFFGHFLFLAMQE